MTTRTDEIGSGILSRVTSVVYWFLVVEGLTVLTTAPALAPVVFLAGGPGNAPLIGLCFLPVAP
ncbi:glycosyl transferase, partial [Kibdelosporangium lantanae]